MKKLALLLAILMFVMSFAACADSTGSRRRKNKDKDEQTTAPSDVVTLPATVPTGPGGSTLGTLPTTPGTPSTPGTSVNPNDPNLSADPHDYEFLLDGIKYRLPSSPQAFLNQGWSFGESGVSLNGTTLDSYDYELYTMVKNGSQIILGIENQSNDTASLASCQVYTVEINADECALPMQLSKGMRLGQGADSVESTYGFPNSYSFMEFYGNTFEAFTYKESNSRYYYNNYFKIECEKGYVYAIKLYCSEDYAGDVPPQVSTQVPDWVDDYQAPDALGTNILLGSIEICGEAYDFPCSLNAFLDNGWKVSRHEGPVAPGEESMIELLRNEVYLSIYVANMEDSWAYPQNCAVYKIVFDELCRDYYGATVRLPEGIELGVSQAVVENLFNSFMVEHTKNEYSTEIEYLVEGPTYLLSVLVSKQSGVVTSFKMVDGHWNYPTN